MGHECVLALFGLTPMHPNVHHSGVPKLHTPAPPSNEKSVKIGTQLRRKMPSKDCIVRCGVRTHALSREPELKSGALDHSANLTRCVGWVFIAGLQDRSQDSFATRRPDKLELVADRARQTRHSWETSARLAQVS